MLKYETINRSIAYTMETQFFLRIFIYLVVYTIFYIIYVKYVNTNILVSRRKIVKLHCIKTNFSGRYP